MHNTKGDVALMNNGRKKPNYFHNIVGAVSKIKVLRAFPQLRYVLTMFLNFGHFSASCSYKKVLIRKECCKDTG